jgi:hypothetical protein
MRTATAFKLNSKCLFLGCVMKQSSCCRYIVKEIPISTTIPHFERERKFPELEMTRKMFAMCFLREVDVLTKIKKIEKNLCYNNYSQKY